MDVSVVIVNWNSGPRLQRQLDSMRGWIEGVCQVLVVDNASHDGSRLSHAEPWFEWVGLDSNRGFAEAANVGIERARSGYVLLLNPDVRVRERSLRRLVERLSASPSTGLAVGPLLGIDQRPQTAFQIRDLPTAWSVLRDVWFIDEVLSLLGRRSKTPILTGEGGAEVQQPAAAYWLLRRAAWEELGGFDPRFRPAWFEDVDFCKRLREGGWRLLYFDDCPADHEGGYSLMELGRSRFISIYYNNLLLYLRKHHPGLWIGLWLPVKLGIVARKILNVLSSKRRGSRRGGAAD